jgi:hypothetical protein
MAGLVPAIHVLLAAQRNDIDARKTWMPGISPVTTNFEV